MASGMCVSGSEQGCREHVACHEVAFHLHVEVPVFEHGEFGVGSFQPLQDGVYSIILPPLGR